MLFRSPPRILLSGGLLCVNRFEGLHPLRDQYLVVVVSFYFFVNVYFLSGGIFLKMRCDRVGRGHKPRTQSGVASQFPHTFTPTNLAPLPHRTNHTTPYRNAQQQLTITSTHYTQRHDPLNTFTLDHAQIHPMTRHDHAYNAPQLD